MVVVDDKIAFFCTNFLHEEKRQKVLVNPHNFLLTKPIWSCVSVIQLECEQVWLATMFHLIGHWHWATEDAGATTSVPPTCPVTAKKKLRMKKKSYCRKME